MEFDLAEWLEYAEGVAKSFAKTFYGIDKDDIYQELALALITKEEKIAAVAKTPSYVKRCLQNVAHSYCMNERAVQFFYSDQYEYTADSVKQLLEKVYSGNVDRLSIPEDMQTVYKDDNLVAFAEISRAVDELPENYKASILDKYKMGYDPETAAERQTFSRAVKRLVQNLNTKKRVKTNEHDGPGSRKAISNGTAGFETNKQAGLTV